MLVETTLCPHRPPPELGRARPWEREAPRQSCFSSLLLGGNREAVTASAEGDGGPCCVTGRRTQGNPAQHSGLGPRPHGARTAGPDLGRVGEKYLGCSQFVRELLDFLLLLNQQLLDRR